jgi:hypothetical protein
MKTFSNTNFTPINNTTIYRNIYIYRSLEQINKFSTSAIFLSQKDKDTFLKSGSFLLFINKIKNKLGSLNSFGAFFIMTVLFFLLIFMF